MTPPRRTMAMGLAALTLTLVAGCGESPPSPSAGSSTPPDLSVIGCATDDPTNVGALTGAWQGNEGGVYYIRHVGSCIWWFGTEVVDVQPGVTGQPGFANVASGRIDGTRIDVEWADVPLGDVMGGGGLTLMYHEEQDQIAIVEQRGDWIPFGATLFTRIDPEASPEAIPSESASL